MSERFAHTLQPVGMGKNPDLWVCVQGAVKHVHNGEADDWGHPELCVWQAVVLGSNDSGLGTVVGGAGTTVLEWWTWLKDTVGSGNGRVYIFSLGANDQFALLGLWDQVQSGDIIIGETMMVARRDSTRTNPRWSGGMTVLGGPPTILQWMWPDRETIFTWMDPQNFGCGNLSHANIGRTSGLAQPLWIGPPHLVPERVGVQVAAVNEWLTDYLNICHDLKLGAMEFTAASQAHQGFRRSYQNDRIEIHDNDAVLRIERESLVGGRCEAYHIGPVSGPMYHLDINSLYPAVAYTQMLPTALECVVKFPDVETVVTAARGKPVIARVLVDMAVPSIPYRYKHGPNKADTRLIWPTGTFWTTLCSPELLLASETGAIVKCRFMSVYTGRPIYRQWVERLYVERSRRVDNGDKAGSRAIKHLLNAGIGRWAKVSSYWQDEPNELCPWPWYQWYQRDDESDVEGVRGPLTHEAGSDNLACYRSLGGRVQRQVTGGEPGETFPAITAHIHSAGRVKLWTLMRSLGSGRCYYVDTDSLWVDEAGYRSLESQGAISTRRLGALKLVARHDHVWFYGQKRYVADGVVTLAGGAMDGHQVNDAFALQLKAPPTSHYLFHKRQPGSERVVAQMRLNLPYEHGHVGADGTVTPIRCVDGIADDNFGNYILGSPRL